MEWTDIIIETGRQQADTAAAIATAFGSGGLYIEDYSDLEQQVLAITHMDLIEQELLDKPRDRVRIHLYVSPDENPAQLVEQLGGQLLAAGVAHTLTTAGVQQEDWETAWKKYYHPIEIGKRLAVAPSWEAYNSDRVTLRLDPGMAFGTGAHETTFLCLELLDAMVQGGEKVLDIGTGSGILGIAAVLLGAASALGVDIDPMCVRTAGENAALNQVADRFTAVAGNLADRASGTYAIITANIVADAIIQLAPAVPRLLERQGCFIASGIIAERSEEVKKALQQAGLFVTGTHTKNGWAALVAVHSAQAAIE